MAKDNSYIDPKPPAPPEEVFGIPTEPLIKISDEIGSLSAASGTGFAYQTLEARRKLKPALTIFPLLRMMSAGQPIYAHEVRRYRKPIKQLSGKVATVDKFAAVSGTRGKLNRKLEKEFEDRTRTALRVVMPKAETFMEQARPEVEFVASFDHPKAQFENEITLIYDAIRTKAEQRAKSHGRKIVTSDDAGYAIRQELGALIANRSLHEDLPLLNHFVLSKLPEKVKLPDERTLSVVAPEIMDIIDGGLPPEKQDRQFVRALANSPNSQRGMAEFIYKNRLIWLGQGADILANVRKLLPAQGSDLLKSFQEITEFLAAFKMR